MARPAAPNRSRFPPCSSRGHLAQAPPSHQSDLITPPDIHRISTGCPPDTVRTPTGVSRYLLAISSKEVPCPQRRAKRRMADRRAARVARLTGCTATAAKGVHSGTAPKFRAAVGRNAAFMRQGSGLTPDCRINAAFRGQCPDAPQPRKKQRLTSTEPLKPTYTHSRIRAELWPLLMTLASERLHGCKEKAAEGLQTGVEKPGSVR